MRSRACLLLIGLAAACGSAEEFPTDGLSSPVVYGTDDRMEVYAHPNAELQRIARESIVALIPTSRIIREDDGDYVISGLTLQQERGLCVDERFGNQPVAATCSGTLIDDDLVLTAGHCIDFTSPCESYRYVFDYYLTAPDQRASIRDEDVYSCQRVLLDHDPMSAGQTPDFAVIQLDRPVEGARSVVSFRTGPGPAQSDSIAMIGFGSGLPAKIDDGASVADARVGRDDFFVVNLDAFGGHSGAATFDSDNLLAGILLGGRVPDYITDPEGQCARVNVFDDSEAGEIVHQLQPIVTSLCQAGWENDGLCSDVPPCTSTNCNGMLPPDGGGGAPSDAVPADSPGCTAARGSANTASLLVALLLFVGARRLRRTSV